MNNIENTNLSDNFVISYIDKKLDEATSFDHYHNAYELVFFAKADIQIFIKDKQYEIQDGDLLFIDEYIIHRIVYNLNTHYTRYVINFKKDFLLSLLKFLNIEFFLDSIKLEHCLKANSNLSQRNEIELLFKSLLKEFSNNPSAEHSTTKAILKANLILILAGFNKMLTSCHYTANSSKKDSQVQALIHFIDSNYMSPVDLDILESRFYISKFQISRIFKEITGFSVMEYVQLRRIIEAKKLLKNSSKEIVDISFDCGFNNIQHFYRTFKKISKVSPYKYRKTLG